MNSSRVGPAATSLFGRRRKSVPNCEGLQAFPDCAGKAVRLCSAKLSTLLIESEIESEILELESR